MKMFLTIARSVLFLVLQVSVTPLFAVVSLLTFLFGPLVRYRIICTWSRMTIALAKYICGIHYQTKGLENIPTTASVVISKHQSAWETLAFQIIFPPQVWVIKKELLYIPFFGWGLAMLSPIAIDRASGRGALRQILQQGKERLSRGFWVVIFPEGTRVRPGSKEKYQIGGAWLAAGSGATVVPVAHNAGELWAKSSLLKYPGVVTVSIGKPIDPRGLSPQEINQRVEAWIESEMLLLPSALCA